MFVLGCDQDPNSTFKNSDESFKVPPEAPPRPFARLGPILDLRMDLPGGPNSAEENSGPKSHRRAGGFSVRPEPAPGESLTVGQVYFDQALGTLDCATTHHFWVGVCSMKASWNWRGPASHATPNWQKAEDDYFALGLIALERYNLADAENCFERQC